LEIEFCWRSWKAFTEIYTHVADEALRTTLERADVLGTLAA
jgi:hypothetical protein